HCLHLNAEDRNQKTEVRRIGTKAKRPWTESERPFNLSAATKLTLALPILSSDFCLLASFFLLKFANEARRCFGDEIARQLDRLSTESANRLHNLQQISAIAR